MRPSDSDQVEFETARREQTVRVVRRQIAGLAVLGLLVLAFSLWRTGLHNVFTPGWWRW
jgi:hypothetical protein